MPELAPASTGRRPTMRAAARRGASTASCCWPAWRWPSGWCSSRSGCCAAVTGDEVTNLPDAIDGIRPAPDAEQVLQQTQVVVDLAEGYEGELTVDGVALQTIRLDELAPVDVEPGQQIEVPPGAVFEPGNGTLRFTPAEGRPIETFDPGIAHGDRHVLAHRGGPDAARSYGWTFDVI